MSENCSCPCQACQLGSSATHLASIGGMVYVTCAIQRPTQLDAPSINIHQPANGEVQSRGPDLGMNVATIHILCSLGTDSSKNALCMPMAYLSIQIGSVWRAFRPAEVHVSLFLPVFVCSCQSFRVGLDSHAVTKALLLADGQPEYLLPPTWKCAISPLVVFPQLPRRHRHPLKDITLDKAMRVLFEKHKMRRKHAEGLLDRACKRRERRRDTFEDQESWREYFHVPLRTRALLAVAANELRVRNRTPPHIAGLQIPSTKPAATPPPSTDVPDSEVEIEGTFEERARVSSEPATTPAPSTKVANSDIDEERARLSESATTPAPSTDVPDSDIDGTGDDRVRDDSEGPQPSDVAEPPPESPPVSPINSHDSDGGAIEEEDGRPPSSANVDDAMLLLAFAVGRGQP